MDLGYTCLMKPAVTVTKPVRGNLREGLMEEMEHDEDVLV